ncbi:MAG: protein kinase [Burkholderiales bacterium]|nr:protein kinase [Burkholderiales bacterium]
MQSSHGGNGAASIYAIDDSPETCGLLRALLGKAGHNVRTFGNGRDGVAAALARPPHLIICDIGMEALDGFGVLEALRADPGTASVPFMFLTGHDDRASFRKALNQRADDYLVKPVQPEELLPAVERCLRGRGHNTMKANSGPARRIDPVSTVRFERFLETADSSNVVSRETRSGAVIYFDIRNFTTYAEHLTAEHVADMLNAFFAKACDPIVQQGGWIVKMMGDAVLAMFDAGRHGSESVLRAVRAALLIVTVASRFREWMSRRYGYKSLPDFAVGIGVHFGDVVVCGLAGEPEGSLTLIGDTVNVAARMEELTRRLGWSVIVSRDVANLTNGRVEFGNSSTVVLRGRDAPIEVVEVLGLRPPADREVQDVRFYQTLRKGILENSSLLSGFDDPEMFIVPFVDGYNLVRKLGQGGMSVVYLAKTAADGAPCVIKLLEIGGNEARAEALDRFIQEYALLSQIRHPNVAEIYTQGFTNTHAYIVMEYFPAGDLRAAIRRGPLSMRQILSYIRDIASALDAIHSADIVHRDLKPANVMLRYDGSAVLADFGIAKHLALNMAYTRVGQVFGTPHYVSPEQALGKQVDHRSDLYSLGVMFYELATGALPYQAQDSAQLLGMHVNGNVPRFPEALSRYQPLLDRLMAKNPRHRFASANELLSVLRFHAADTAGSLFST